MVIVDLACDKPESSNQLPHKSTILGTKVGASERAVRYAGNSWEKKQDCLVLSPLLTFSRSTFLNFLNLSQPFSTFLNFS
jgi:hypothetical protein